MRPDTKAEVIVLGPPRSGTSMTAGILSILGVDMGNIRLPDYQNPKGYFEDRDLMYLVDKIIHAAGAQYNGFNPPSSRVFLTVKSQFKDEVKYYVDKRLSTCKSRYCGFKLPTMIFVLDLFLPYFHNPFFVVVVRNLLDIAKSMVRYTQAKNHLYEELNLIQALNLASFYYENIFSFFVKNPDLKVQILSFENIVSDPQKNVNSLVRFLNIECSSSQIRQACNSVASPSKIKLVRAIHILKNLEKERYFNFIKKCLQNPLQIPKYIFEKWQKI